jgi:hypothetical protein
VAVEEQAQQVQRRASERAPPVLQEQAQVSRLELAPELLLEQLPEPEPERQELPPVPEPVQPLADWQVVVPSSHLTLALSSCIRSSPGQQKGRRLLQRALTSRA